jgi:hypothetical protein
MLAKTGLELQNLIVRPNQKSQTKTFNKIPLSARISNHKKTHRFTEVGFLFLHNREDVLSLLHG